MTASGDKFRPSPPSTPSDDLFIDAGVRSMFLNIGVYEPEGVAGRGHPLFGGRLRACTLQTENSCRSHANR
jgi:hypothetical protein